MSNRDDKIVQLTDRYRLGTNAAFHRMVFDGQSLNAVTKVTARMCRQGLLCRYPLIPPEDYFTLGPAAVRQLGHSLRRIEPLGPQALPIDYAVLLYATHGDRVRLQTAELQSWAPWLPDEMAYLPYCRTSGGVLELIRVDLGGSPQHIAKKATADCARRLEIPEFRQLVEADRFQLVLLTTTSSKARLIRQAIEALAWETRTRLHFATISRLTLLHLRHQ